MSDNRPSADYYRSVAGELERLAGETRSPDIQRELRELAERFRRMAERRERQG
jgi:hypothetical protein